MKLKIFTGQYKNGVDPVYTDSTDKIRSIIRDYSWFEDVDGKWWCAPQDLQAVVYSLCCHIDRLNRPWWVKIIDAIRQNKEVRDE